jgi:hypothetical protein
VQRGLARVLDPFWMVRAPHFSVANEASRGQELCRQSIDNDNSGDVVQVCISPLRIIFTVTSCYSLTYCVVAGGVWDGAGLFVLVGNSSAAEGREREAVLEALRRGCLNRWQTRTRTVPTARPSLCR